MITDYLKLRVCVYVLRERVCVSLSFIIFKLNLERVTYIFS